eukprot:6214718-Pleurochrysis_carterae.AAC.2
MAEPARTTGSGLSHPPTIPGAADEARARGGRRRTGRGGGLTPRAAAGVASAPLPRRSPRGRGAATRGISHARQTQVTEERQEGWALVASGPTP